MLVENAMVTSIEVVDSEILLGFENQDSPPLNPDYEIVTKSYLTEHYYPNLTKLGPYQNNQGVKYQDIEIADLSNCTMFLNMTITDTKGVPEIENFYKVTFQTPMGDSVYTFTESAHIGFPITKTEPFSLVGLDPNLSYIKIEISDLDTNLLDDSFWLRISISNDSSGDLLDPPTGFYKSRLDLEGYGVIYVPVKTNMAGDDRIYIYIQFMKNEPFN